MEFRACLGFILWTANVYYTDNEVVWESKPLRVEYILA